MDVPAIIDGLAHAEGLPAEAIRAPRAQREAVAPALIDLIERYLDGDEAAMMQEPALFWAFHLLGEWRESAAYRPLARLLALEEGELGEVLGEANTETVHRVMAVLFDGDPQPLYEVIEAERADPFVRSRMLETLAMLALTGVLCRDEVARYLRTAFDRLRQQDADFVWFGWLSAIAALRLTDLSDLVREAFERGLIDALDMRFADFETDFRYACDHPEAPWDSPLTDEFAPFGDTLEEFASWHLGAGRSEDLDEDWAPDYRIPAPAVNPWKGVGRNDPCPCGSGKKFKRCCLV
jgi:uncharacterized protein